MDTQNGLFVAIDLLVTVALVVTTWKLARRARRMPSRRVENYALSIEDREGGFPFVQMKLQTSDGFATFELEPPYAHVLSDELLSTSARAWASKLRPEVESGEA